MTEFWRWFLYVGGGLIFTISVLDSAVRAIRHFKRGKSNVGKHFDNKVKKIIIDDRRANCPLLVNAERDAKSRELELKLLKDTLITALEPIKKDISEIKDLTMKLHHSQMTDLQIKLNHLFHEKFDKKGSFTKAEQSNWDKWYSDYFVLGGNSDIKRMDDLIQAARVKITLDKINKKKESEENTNEN